MGDSVVLDCHDWEIIKVVEEKKKKKPKGMIYNEITSTFKLPYIIPEYMKALLEASKATSGRFIEFRNTRMGKNYMYGLYKDIKKEKERTKRKKALAELRNRPYFKTVITEVRGKPSRKENLEKIKFPCYCRFNGRRYGIITRTKANEAFDNEFYTLHGVEKQHSSVSSVRSYYNLEDLIRVWDIEILKGEVHLWREVE